MRMRWMAGLMGLLLAGMAGAQTAPSGAALLDPPPTLSGQCEAGSDQPLGLPEEPAFSAILREQAQALMARQFAPSTQIPETSPTLKPEGRGETVGLLEAALIERGLLAADPAGPRQRYDAAMVAAVKEAQGKFGLIADGVAGPLLYMNLNQADATLGAALNAWADEVDRQVEQARSDGARYIVVVNVPSFTLHLLDVATGIQALESRVVVGKSARKTPLFTTHIVNLKFNPDWTPPPSLVKTGHVYVRPGPNNPLGLMRFSTDNDQNIYLHDTNEHKLFSTSNRARSSGCIRVQQWRSLAEWLSGESACALQKTLDTGKTTYQKLPKTPVVLTYARVDYVEGGIGVRPDVYAIGDAAVGAQELSRPAPVRPQSPSEAPESQEHAPVTATM